MELGDARRTRQLIKMMEDRSASPTGSVPPEWRVEDQGCLPFAGQPRGGLAGNSGGPYHANGRAG